MDQSLDNLAGRIVVTGGAGFIGSALVAALNRRGLSKILIVDRLGQDEKWRNLAPLQFDDYLDAAAFRSLITGQNALQDVTCLFHLGACSSTAELDSGYLLDNNYAYTCELARWSLTRGIRFLYASSAATYGDGSSGYDEQVPLHQLRPLNAYGYSKHLLDQHADRRGWLDQAVGLKYFNVFGPNEAHKGTMRSVVCKAFDEIRTTGKVSLFRSHRDDYQDGMQQRDFLYVKDAVEMTLWLAGAPGCAQLPTGLFNLGSGQATTWLDLVRPIFRALDSPERIEFIDMPPELRAKYQYYTCAQTAKLRQSGYPGPRWSVPEAVADYVSNYLAPDLRLGDQPATP